MAQRPFWHGIGTDLSRVARTGGPERKEKRMKKPRSLLRIVGSVALGVAAVGVGPAYAQIPVPEPSSFSLLATAVGLGGAWWWLFRRK